LGRLWLARFVTAKHSWIPLKNKLFHSKSRPLSIRIYDAVKMKSEEENGRKIGSNACYEY